MKLMQWHTVYELTNLFEIGHFRHAQFLKSSELFEMYILKSSKFNMLGSIDSQARPYNILHHVYEQTQLIFGSGLYDQL